MIRYFFLLLIATGFAACQEPVEGCTNPRASNFDPRADVDMGCNYFGLQLLMQYGHNANTSDAYNYDTLLYDVDNTPFVINQMPFMLSHIHLVRPTGEEEIGPEDIAVFDATNTRYYTEDNFAIIAPTKNEITASGWVALGDFDKLRFRVGLPQNVRNTLPSRITEEKHPLSTSASIYMYDSTATQYATTFVELSIANTSQIMRFDFFDNWDIELPYVITAVDGAAVGINLRLNYAALFDGISFNSDDSTTIHTKISQNIPNAFSTY